MMEKQNRSNSALTMAIIGSLTLGLAPFVPEPHIVGKIRWVMGGAVGMQPMDWFDLVLHGAPWMLLLFVSVQKLKVLIRKNKVASSKS